MEKTISTLNFFNDYQKILKTMEKVKADEFNPFYKSKYVPLKHILSEVKKVCIDNNFIFYQKTFTKNDKNYLKTVIEHKSGRKLEGIIEIISKDNTDPQKVGAGLTYMRRYSLTCMFGIEEKDDDGNLPAKPATKKDLFNKAKTMIENNKNANILISYSEKLKESKNFNATQIKELQTLINNKVNELSTSK